jgi:hypothetical protein
MHRSLDRSTQPFGRLRSAPEKYSAKLRASDDVDGKSHGDGLSYLKKRIEEANERA